MATSTNKGYTLQANGSNAGTWGDELNTKMIEYVDLNLGGTYNQGLTTGTVTLSTDNSRNVILRLTGALSGNVTLITECIGFFFVENLTTNNYTVKIRNTNYGVNGVEATVVQNTKTTLISDSAYGVRIVSSYGIDPVTSFSAGTTGLTPSTTTTGAVTLAGTLNVANGGTGSATLTANNVLLGNGTSALQVVAPGTSGNFLTSNGTTWTSSTYVAINYGTITATTSGTAVPLNNIFPSGTKRIQLMFSGVSLTGNDYILVQLGYGAGPTWQETSYRSVVSAPNNDNASSSVGILATSYTSSGNLMTGIMTLLRFGTSSNLWMSTSQIIETTSEAVRNGTGYVTLPDVITSLRIKPTGTNSFDAGSINVTWEV